MSYRDASSSSLKKTMREILEFTGANLPIKGRSLRYNQEVIIADLAVRAFKKGYKQGHAQSYAAFKETKKVPPVLKYEARKRLAPNQTSDISVTSKIKK